MKQLGQCDALDMNGKRCRWKAISAESYHGDSEIYPPFGDQPRWVRVEFCAKHVSPYELNKREP